MIFSDLLSLQNMAYAHRLDSRLYAKNSDEWKSNKEKLKTIEKKIKKICGDEQKELLKIPIDKYEFSYKVNNDK